MPDPGSDTGVLVNTTVTRFRAVGIDEEAHGIVRDEGVWQASHEIARRDLVSLRDDAREQHAPFDRVVIEKQIVTTTPPLEVEAQHG